MTRTRYDAVVIGAGPAGLVTAICLASNGLHTAIAGPPYNPDPEKPDTRTTALLQASVSLLQNTGVWPLCSENAAALEKIRLIDDTGRLLRAPDVTFDCNELNTGPFGYNIPNSALVAALYRRARDLPNLDVIQTAGAENIATDSDQVKVHLAEKREIAAKLVVGADGRNSICRKAASIATKIWAYPQKAIAFNFFHDEPHGNCSNEFHRANGPFTTVPLPGKASSLVWVESPEEADRIMALPEAALIEALEERLHGILGTVTGVGPRAAFPLSGMSVEKFAANRIALIGEAAHVIPPIGAQGLNLGFRDAAALADCVCDNQQNQRGPGSHKALQSYDRSRRSDVGTRTLAVDLLNRSLISSHLPLHALRGVGLHVMKNIGPVRRLFMREGLAPSARLPRLMQSAASAN